MIPKKERNLLGHHSCCRCFKISVEDLKKFEKILRMKGFKEAPQLIEDGQFFGLVKKLDRVWQIHVRTYKNGEIKAEIEPRWIYIEHLFTPSYSAHQWVQKLLEKHGLTYNQKNPVPLECLNPKIKIPSSLTNWKIVGEKFLVKLFLKKYLKKCKIRVNSLEDLKTFFIEAMNAFYSFTSINLLSMVVFKFEDGKLRMKIRCPIKKTHKEWCERKCIPLMNCILEVVNKKIGLERLNFSLEDDGCEYCFFMR